MYIIRPRARSLPLAWVSRGSGAHTTSRPSSTEANTKRPIPSSRARVSGTAQRMEGSITPLAQKLGITIDTGVKVDDDEDGAHQAKRERDFGSWN